MKKIQSDGNFLPLIFRQLLYAIDDHQLNFNFNSERIKIRDAIFKNIFFPNWSVRFNYLGNDFLALASRRRAQGISR